MPQSKCLLGKAFLKTAVFVAHATSASRTTRLGCCFPNSTNVLPGTATEDAFEWFKSEVDLRAKAVKELAEEFNLPFIPLQEDLDKLTEVAPAEYWLKDGVHPTVFFHQHIAKKWIDTFLAIE